MHPDNKPLGQPDKHCWHHVPLGRGREFIESQRPEIARCCKCNITDHMLFEPMAGHGPYCDPRSIPPFVYMKEHPPTELCPGSDSLKLPN